MLGVSFLLVSILAPVTLIFILANTYYTGTKNFKLSAISLNLVQLTQFISVVSIAYLTSDILYSISAFLISTIIANLISIFFILNKYKNYIGLNHIDITESALEDAGASKLNVSSIFSGFVYQLDKLLLFHFVGAAQLAIYSIVLAISDQLRAPFKAVSSIFLPRMSENNTNKSKVLKLFTLMTLFSVILTAFLISINPYIFKYIFPKYIDYTYLANAASLIIIFSSGSILMTFLQARKNFEIINNNAILMTILMLALYPIAALYQSLLMFIVFRNVIGGLCVSYLLYKVVRLK
jgi:O-antigen/teichoic acid export membrane protein